MSQSRLESRRFKSSEPLRSRHALLYCIGLTGRPRGKSFVAAKTTATSQQANKPTSQQRQEQQQKQQQRVLDSKQSMGLLFAQTVFGLFGVNYVNCQAHVRVAQIWFL